MHYRVCLQRLTTSNIAYSQHRRLLQTGSLSFSLRDEKQTTAGTRTSAQTQTSPKACQPKKELPRSQLHRRSGGVTGASLPKPTLLLSTLSAPLSSRLQSQLHTSLAGPVYSTMATPSDPQAAPPADNTATTQENGTAQDNGAPENSSDEEFTMPLSKYCHLFPRLSQRSQKTQPNLTTSPLVICMFICELLYISFMYTQSFLLRCITCLFYVAEWFCSSMSISTISQSPVT